MFWCRDSSARTAGGAVKLSATRWPGLKTPVSLFRGRHLLCGAYSQLWSWRVSKVFSQKMFSTLVRKNLRRFAAELVRVCLCLFVCRMISQVFILSSQGDHLIYKDCILTFSPELNQNKNLHPTSLKQEHRWYFLFYFIWFFTQCYGLTSH